MGFEFHPLMLAFAAVGGLGIYVILNHRKVHEGNQRKDARSRLPRFFHRTYKDPHGRRNRFAAVGVVVMSVAGIIAIGTGVIDV